MLLPSSNLRSSTSLPSRLSAASLLHSFFMSTSPCPCAHFLPSLVFLPCFPFVALLCLNAATLTSLLVDTTISFPLVTVVFLPFATILLLLYNSGPSLCMRMVSLLEGRPGGSSTGRRSKYYPPTPHPSLLKWITREDECWFHGRSPNFVGTAFNTSLLEYGTSPPVSSSVRKEEWDGSYSSCDDVSMVSSFFINTYFTESNH